MFMTNQEQIDDRTMRIERPDVKGSGYIEFPPQKPFSESIVAQPPTVSHEALPEYYQNMPKGRGAVGRGAPAPQGRGMVGRGQYQPAPSQVRPQMQAPTGQRPAQHGAPQSGYVPQQHARPAASGYGMAGRTSMPGRGLGRSQQPQVQAVYDGRESYQPATNGYQVHANSIRTPAPQVSQQPAGGSGRGGYASQGRGTGRMAPAAGRSGYAPMPVAVSASGGVPGRGRGAPGGGRGAAAHAVVAPRQPAMQAPARPAAAPPPAPAVAGDDSDDENTSGMSRSQLKRLRKKKRDGKAS